MTRGVEALEQRPDAAIKDDDMHYLQQHGIKNLLSSTLQELLKCRTVDPIQFIIDCMKLGVDKAAQDPKLQIAVWRVDKLAEVFAFIDQVCNPWTLRGGSSWHAVFNWCTALLPPDSRR